MDLNKLIQTTIFLAREENAGEPAPVTAIFVPKDLSFYELSDALGIAVLPLPDMRHISAEYASQIGRFLVPQLNDSEAYQLLYAREVVIEQSPPDLTSIVDLIRRATGVGIGAWAGIQAAPTPGMLFITIPAGMMIIGAASGIGAALESGLRERLLRMLMPPRRPRPIPRAKRT